MLQLETHEDRGWVGVANRDVLKALAASLKCRTAKTIFAVYEEDGKEVWKCQSSGAAELAREASRKFVADQVILNIPEELELRGMKLSKLTQASVDAVIKEKKGRAFRPATDRCSN